MIPQSSEGFHLERITKEENLAAVNYEWHDHQPGWTKQQHYSYRRPLTWSTWCHGWHNQC